MPLSPKGWISSTRSPLRALYGIFGSIDMNRGDPRNGWDTDQFPNNAQELIPSLVQIVEDGGFQNGGFNFDAKLRRQSVDPQDLYIAHIGGIDTLAQVRSWDGG